MTENPSLTVRDLNARAYFLLAVSGAAGTIVFLLLSQVSMVLFGRLLHPTNLITKVAKTVLGVDIALPTAEVTHLLTGIVFYPLGFVLILIVLKMRSAMHAGLLLGVATWFFAQGILSPIIGRPFMNGFGSFTWVSLVGHSLYGLTVAIVFALLWRDLERQ